MHPDTRYLFFASMDIAPEKEALFNEVYDTEHVPALLTVPGVLGCVRCTASPLRLAIGGSVKTVDVAGEPRYTAIYELASDDVLVSEAWASAVERGRWPTEIRPYLSNHRHRLLRLR